MKTLTKLILAAVLMISVADAKTVIMTPSGSTSAGPVPVVQAERSNKEVTVWVNTRSGVYHCPASRWYGNTKQGRFMGECEARADGYRPAYGNPCGSDCN
jgi:hypothetical protein